KHLDIAKFMIALRKINPPPPPPNDVINIGPSLDFLTSLEHNNDMPILDLLHKTVFFIALESACRPSDFQRIELKSLQKLESG
ncbi:628_t:CDS:1, partial [Racocetra persica]